MLLLGLLPGCGRASDQCPAQQAFDIVAVRGEVVEVRPIQIPKRRRGEQQAPDVEAGTVRSGYQPAEPIKGDRGVISVKRHEPRRAPGVAFFQPVCQVTEPQSFAILDDTGGQVIRVIAAAVNARGDVQEVGEDGVPSTPVAAYVFLHPGVRWKGKKKERGFPVCPNPA